MKKLSVIFCACCLVIIIHTYLIGRQLDEASQKVDQLAKELRQEQAKIEDLQAQQQTINAISEDLSARLADAQSWRK